MVQNDSYYKGLVLGYIKNSISADQVKELYAFIQSDPEKYALMLDEPEVVFLIKQQMEAGSPEILAETEERLQQRIKEAMEQVKPAAVTKKPILVRMATNWRWAAAAVIVITVATIALVLSVNKDKDKNRVVTTNNKPGESDAPPGKNGAILTLADGTKVLLDSAGNGVLTTQGKTTILIRNNQLVYDASSKQQEVLYNTMTTPKGRQYQLVLPDGSQVWLNAASSITYPTVFAGKERGVTLTGEAYFEVAKDRSKPFHVKVNDLDVQVLGTHFNINSYRDEAAVKTTLLEGSVSVSGNGQTRILKPGQQAVADGRQLTIVDEADVEMAMAWKNGKFQFDHTPLPVVMRQLSRWYDLEVQYVKDTPDVVFAGKMGRDLKLSQVLNVLSKMEVNFKVEGKKLIVMP